MPSKNEEENNSSFAHEHSKEDRERKRERDAMRKPVSTQIFVCFSQKTKYIFRRVK